MWITCLQENLSRGLGVVGRAVATRATLPVTQNVLLTTDQSRLKLTATNLEIAISTWIGAQIDHEGSVTIPARLLTEFVNQLPDAKIEIDLVDTPKRVALKCALFKANMNGTDAEEFPPIPTVEDGTTITVPGDVLKGAIERVAFAAATEDSRPVLTGIKVEIAGNKLTLAAADGFRLGVETVELGAEAEEDMGFIVPARTMQEVQRLIGDRADDITVTVTEPASQVLFKFGDIEIVSQLVQGAFPDYAKLIPASAGTTATVQLQDFLQATRAASIFARDGSGIVRLIVTPGEDGELGKVTVASRAEEVGDNEVEFEATIDGDEAKVAFDGRYLLDVLGVLGSGDVTLETTTPSSPGVIRATDRDGYTHVVMPMFVQW
ncbi:MAG: DNA polymerase III subunit beta [Dehalococcoidia bacterium]|jgi:DNA polymerase-3 subunit beta|nr:DNA polymerase III subunit beta [Chloroflexota bacterium]MDP5876457.1 DNA polymerase III subunit beta [Dehalococcoidia bacterium]MDP6273950.1 DNA polymerase III subunit beta [Dehalococcoidia bacterium]MDP7160334.1 DNA polymerase III subunit beta [Dehalococcoidia bacterium]MDP7213531.1 DNA polymerase III subunit beta [Dehalococcoidia bacterium]